MLRNIGRALARLRGEPTRQPQPAPDAAPTPAMFATPPSVYLGDYTALTLLERRLMIFVDTRGTDVAPHLLMRGYWERNYTTLFESLIRPGDTVLDLGANLGVYALLAAAATGPSGRVHAFEPNARYAELIFRSLAVNGFGGHAQVHDIAVGEAEGVAELLFTWGWGGGGHLSVAPGAVPPGAEMRACRVAALDTLFADPGFTVDVIKMDVEGAEGRALRGMWQLLERSPDPRVIFEFAPAMLEAQGVGAEELIYLFSELGFRFWSIGPRSELTPVTGAALTAMGDGVRNILAARGAPLPPPRGPRA
jgi:FkbM family methyltransferase